MSLVLEEDGEMAYCSNCGKAGVLPPGEKVPLGWLYAPNYAPNTDTWDGIERFCSETCETEWMFDGSELADEDWFLGDDNES